MWANNVHTCIVTRQQGVGEGSGCKKGVTRRGWRSEDHDIGGVWRGGGAGGAGGRSSRWRQGLKGAARFIQRGLQPAGVELGEGKGWTAGQTKPLLLHFCPSGQTPTLYTRALPSYARLVHSLSSSNQSPEPLNAPSSCTFSTLLFEFVN